MSDLEHKYSITLKENQETKHRRFFIKGRYLVDYQQDKQVYKHKKKNDCYIVYKTNRMKALNGNNWDDYGIVKSISKFDETKYEQIYGESKMDNDDTSQNLTFENEPYLLRPLWNLHIFSLEQLWENIDYICPIELTLPHYCQCPLNLMVIFS